MQNNISGAAIWYLMLSNACCNNFSEIQKIQNSYSTNLKTQILEQQMTQQTRVYCDNKLYECFANVPEQCKVVCGEEKSKMEMIDEILFPDDPIREYTNKRIKEINEKYDKIICEFDKLLLRGAV